MINYFSLDNNEGFIWRCLVGEFLLKNIIANGADM
jgi:hypothetical protein